MTSKINKHLNVGDTIKIISGSHKGKVGLITYINTKKNLANIDSVPSRIKQLKLKEGESPKQAELKVFIHISNLMLWDKASNEASRVGYRFIGGKKVRYFKKSGLSLESK